MYNPGQTPVTFSMILPPPMPHAVPRRVPRLAPTRTLPVILPPPVEFDDGDLPTLATQIDHEPCDCGMCAGTHRVVNAMGRERACDYCACAPEVSL